MKGHCEINGCNQLAKWGLYKTRSDGQKVWLHVCDEHEEQIASENLRRLGGYIHKAKSLKDRIIEN